MAERMTAWHDRVHELNALVKGKKRAHQPGYHLEAVGKPGHLRHDWLPDDAPTGVALFAGAGGASIGVHNAGVRLIGAYDFDESAIESHRALMPDHPAEVADLSTLPSLPKADVWWASPPCQPFSDAGDQRGSQDERNGYPHLLRLLRDSPPPTWLVIENVPGIMRHSKTAGCGPLLPKPDQCRGCYLESVERELRKHFPHVQSRVLDAADFGVPQHRLRHITVCGPTPVEWPDPTHGPEAEQPWVSAGEALGAQVFGGGTNPHGPGREHERTLRDLTNEPATTIPASHAGNNSLYISDPAGLYLVAAGLNSQGGHNEGRPRGLDRPSPAVSTKGTLQLVRAGETPGTFTRVRTLTVPERTVLMGMPVHPSLTGKQVGNAVVPPLAEAVVGQVVAAHRQRGGQ